MHLMLTLRTSGPFWLEIEVLKLTSKPYLKTQKHFFIAFRTKLGIGLRASVDVFGKRNTSTHFSDAIVDATIFSKRRCTYDRTFRLLYAIDWIKVVEYGF